MGATSWPRVAVVGAGAVGGYFGGMLARAGAPVTLIGRAAHVDAWNRDGLLIDGVSFREHIAVGASTDLAEARGAELVLFSVKSPDTEATARALAPVLSPTAVVVSLQNGVDNVDRMRTAAGLDPIGAVVYVASSMPEPGVIKHDGRGDLVIGDVPRRQGPPRGETIDRVAAYFEAAGVPCRVSANIEADLWTKLIINAALNAISAAVHATYGEVVAVPESRDTVRHAVEECVAVAKAAGVVLPAVDYVEMVQSFAARVGAVYSSTDQDLRRGKRTEIDALNGLIVRRGAELRVPTPVNQALTGLIKLREASPRQSAAGLPT
jgi:2-dehydropantoate 2-reductase